MFLFFFLAVQSNWLGRLEYMWNSYNDFNNKSDLEPWVEWFSNSSNKLKKKLVYFISIKFYSFFTSEAICSTKPCNIWSK